jgi:hypothetical protein
MNTNKDYFKQSINTDEDAKRFLTQLHNDNLLFHPEHSPYLITVKKDGKDVQLFTQDECLDLVNRLDEIHTVLHDPCEFIVSHLRVNKL